MDLATSSAMVLSFSGDILTRIKLKMQESNHCIPSEDASNKVFKQLLASVNPLPAIHDNCLLLSILHNVLWWPLLQTI